MVAVKAPWKSATVKGRKGEGARALSIFQFPPARPRGSCVIVHGYQLMPFSIRQSPRAFSPTMVSSPCVHYDKSADITHILALINQI